MKLSLKQLPITVEGPARRKLLEPEAADSLRMLEEDTGGLIYNDMYRDPVAGLMSNRYHHGSLLPAYSGHGYGWSLDLDLKAVLNSKKITYESLLFIMRKRGWFAVRRDGDEGGTASNHFNYLGEFGDKYIAKCSLDPVTWNRPMEDKIYEKFGKHFQVDLPTCQVLLAKIGLYSGPFTGTLDQYTREALMAFQRTWNLSADGTAGPTTCRVLVFIAAEREILPAR